ncbi:MAG TPA: PPC domain-containing protein [Phototrophicaceae bacterium]|nr:PPC domain-containing protein [Phototrophicaceae bacterium]
MKRAGWILLLIVLLVGVSVQAQGLSASDGKLLAAADGTAITSAAFQYEAHLTVSGFDPFALQADLTGSGAFDHSASALDLSAKGNITVGTTQTIPVNSELRWLKDTLYLNPGAGWQSMSGASDTLANLVSLYLGLDTDPAKLSQWDLSSMAGLTDVIAALTSGDSSAFLTTQRLTDANGDAHFQSAVDLHALFQSESFVKAMIALANAQGTFMVTYDHDQFKQVNQANSAMFANAKVTVDQYVGLSDSQLQRIVLTLDLPIDPTQGSFPDAAFKISASLDVTLSDLNQPQNITAPDGANTVTAFTFPAPPALAEPDGGLTQYVFVKSMAAQELSLTSFDAQAGDQVTVTVRGLGLDFDGIASILAPNGDTLAQNDNHDHPGFLLGDYDPQIVNFQIPADGTYNVEVTEYDGNAGSYVLIINIQR